MSGDLSLAGKVDNLGDGPATSLCECDGANGIMVPFCYAIFEVSLGK